MQSLGIRTACQLFVVACVALTANRAQSQQQNGPVQRRIVEEPRRTTTWETVQETRPVDRFVQDTEQRQRLVYTPVTEYRVEPRVHNWWNPFAPSYVAYHMIPTTRWETKVQTYNAPVVRHERTVEHVTVKRPTHSLSIARYEQVVPSAPLTPNSITPRSIAPQGMPATALANRGGQLRQASGIAPAVNRAQAVNPRMASRVGGVQALQSDPPQRGFRQEVMQSDRGTVYR